MNFGNDLTAKYVRSILDYNPGTGLFVWKFRSDVSKKWNTRYVGKAAGRISNGYIGISINKKRYQAHRLAWLCMTGKWPEFEVDHRNTNRGNNKWNNLREATSSQNKGNARLRSDNTSKTKGVSWCSEREKWFVSIFVNGRQKNLGRFNFIKDARKAYLVAAKKHFGEFSRAA